MNDDDRDARAHAYKLLTRENQRLFHLKGAVKRAERALARAPKSAKLQAILAELREAEKAAWARVERARDFLSSLTPRNHGRK